MFSFLAGLGEKGGNIFVSKYLNSCVLWISLWKDHLRKEQDWQFWVPWLTFKPQDCCGTCWPDHPAIQPSLDTKIFDITRHSKNVSYGVWCLCGLSESWVTYVSFWTLWIAQAFTSQFPFTSNKCWSEGEGNTEQHHPLCRMNQNPSSGDPLPLILLWEGRKVFPCR